MQKLLIKGKRELSVTISISGSKNASFQDIILKDISLCHISVKDISFEDNYL